MPNRGPEFMTTRSRVSRSTTCANQVSRERKKILMFHLENLINEGLSILDS